MSISLKDVFTSMKDEDKGPQPSKHGRILFILSDYDSDFSPLIVGHEGFYIDEEISSIGHKEVAEIIPMPKEFQQSETGFFVWEGEVDWECVSGGGWGYESPSEYDMTLDKGTVRKATSADLALARGDFHIPSAK